MLYLKSGTIHRDSMEHTCGPTHSNPLVICSVFYVPFLVVVSTVTPFLETLD